MRRIHLIHAPSILGLRPSGVQFLGQALLQNGLTEKLHAVNPVQKVDDLNDLYSKNRDMVTHCLNSDAIRDFSMKLSMVVEETVRTDQFAFVLGGDCSILIGVMHALKCKGDYGLVFIDAHADFYLPHQSTTGEVADMDLAIVAGYGPDMLTDIDELKPYVNEEHVIHIGQRDEEETIRYHSLQIKDTRIKCLDWKAIRQKGIETITTEILYHTEQIDVEGFWIHFDTDVLADHVNPAVDYRLQGGMELGEAEYLVRQLLMTGRMIGMTITIFNPNMDKAGAIAKKIVGMLVRMFGTK